MMGSSTTDSFTDRGEEVLRDSPTPYHRQLSDILERRIREGLIPEKERLPSELELADRFGLSRSTVRQALQTLATRGYVVHVPNRGYFAASPPQERGWLIQDTAGFLENEVGHHNRAVTTEVLSARHERLPGHASRALRLPEPGEGFVLVRKRMLDGRPALIGTNYLPPHVERVVAAASDVLRGEASLTQVLAKAGFVTFGAQRIIHALGAPADVCERLGVPEGTALIRIRSATWDRSMEPFDYYETWLRSDVVPLEVTTTTVALGSVASAQVA